MLLCFMLLKMCFTFLSANGEINGFHMSIDDDTKMTHASDATRYENVWQFIDANARKFSDCLLTTFCNEKISLQFKSLRIKCK